MSKTTNKFTPEVRDVAVRLALVQGAQSGPRCKSSEMACQLTFALCKRLGIRAGKGLSDAMTTA